MLEKSPIEVLTSNNNKYRVIAQTYNYIEAINNTSVDYVKIQIKFLGIWITIWSREVEYKHYFKEETDTYIYYKNQALEIHRLLNE